MAGTMITATRSMGHGGIPYFVDLGHGEIPRQASQSRVERVTKTFDDRTVLLGNALS
jgi:hypothetical protein